MKPIVVGYQHKGFAGRVGFGRRPAVVVVDVIQGFTSTKSTLGSNYDTEMKAITQLLSVARSRKVPIAFTTVVYDDPLAEAGAFLRKVPSLAWLVRGSKWTKLDARLKRRPSEPLMEKKFASAFFGTALGAWLTTSACDTVIVCGFTTSGCVRATVVDALQYGYRTSVPRECVGDRSEAQHAANLVDIEGKYGDVVAVAVVEKYLNSESKRRK